MKRHRTLVLSTGLALVFALQLSSLPIQFSPSTALAQSSTVTEAGDRIDLAVVALHCAAAPGAESLTAFFTTGAPPTRCAPAVGVTIAVTENEIALPGSPFTTDVDGSLGVRVRLGSAVEVREDPKSLPPGYEPLLKEFNGVPYANPVQLDSAVAGAAVLFVNVRAADATTLATTATQSIETAPDRVGCVAAYPDESTCIAPGLPLAAPCAITAARNFTVLAPDPRGLDADSDGIGCEPIAPVGGVVFSSASLEQGAGGDYALPAATVAQAAPIARYTPAAESALAAPIAHAFAAAPVSDSGDGHLAFAHNPVRIANAVWTWPGRDRSDDWFAHGHTNRHWPRHIRIGHLAFARSGSDSFAVVSNAVRINTGTWSWPVHNRTNDWVADGRHGNDDRFEHAVGARRWPANIGDNVWGWPRHIAIGHLSVAGSGNGSLAVSSNAVRIGSGFRFWPSAHRDGNWRPHDVGVSVSSVVAARSGNGSLAVVTNVVRIGTGVWLLPPSHHRVDNWPWLNRVNTGVRAWPRHIGSGVWIWSGVIARSGNGSFVVSGGFVRIGAGGWGMPFDRGRDDDWRQDREDVRADKLDVEPLVINGGLTVELAPGKLEQFSASEPPSQTVIDGLAAAESPADTIEPASDSSIQSSSEVTIASPPDNAVQSAPDTALQSAPDGAVQASLDAGATDSGSVESSAVASAPEVDPSYVDPGYVASESEYVDPGYVDPAYAAPEPDYVDPGYVAADPVAVDPGYVAPEPEYIAPEPNYVAPEPAYSDPSQIAVGTGDFGNSDPGFAMPEAAPDPGYVDPVFVAPDPGANSGFAAPDSGGNANFAAPEPIGVDPGNGGFGNGDPVAAAPDLGGDSGADPGFVAPSSDDAPSARGEDE